MPASGRSPGLSSPQALEAAYRFVAGYYDYVRIGSIQRLLEAIAGAGDKPDADDELWPTWQACVHETLDGAPMPSLPPAWDT